MIGISRFDIKNCDRISSGDSKKFSLAKINGIALSSVVDA
jgi:hypothetical protein